MPSVDLIDESYVAVPPASLVPRVTDAGLWRAWFPGLQREVFMDRGEKGVRWSVSGEAHGSVEVWLEPAGRGTIVHWYVRVEPDSGRGDVLRQRYQQAVDQGMFLLKDQAEQQAAGR